MKMKFIMMLVVLLSISGGAVFGSVVGTVTGTITDGTTGDPVVGASVSIKGTSMGAMANQEGVYRITNVPVGTYTLSITAVSYATVEIDNVQVSADLASYHDMGMTSEATELGTVIRVTAEAPMILKDKTTTINIVKREELLAMPTRGFEQVVGIQNSVVRMNSNVNNRQRGGGARTASGGEINLRGGRPSEVAYYVDGFSMQDPLSGASTSNINNNAIKEISVVSGAFSAEYGNVASGIVNVVMNSGTDKYQGNVELLSDNAASIFGYDSFDQNWYSGDFSGPLPGLDKAYFFISGERQWHADRTPSSKTKEIYEEFGLDTLTKVIDNDTVLMFENPQRQPANYLDGWSYQGKFDFNPTDKMKLFVTGNGSITTWQRYLHYYLNPAFPNQVYHSPKYEDKNLNIAAKINHVLNDNTFWNFSVSYFNTERIIGDGVVFDDYEAYERFVEYNGTLVDIANPEYDFHNLFREGDSITAADLDPSIEIGGHDDTLVTFMESYVSGYSHRKSSYIGVKGDITSELGDYHTVKSGFEFQRHTLRNFINLDATKGWQVTRVNRYGFDSLGVESDDESFMNETKHPINLGAYVKDRFEYQGFIVDAGLRLDLFDYNTLSLRNLERPFDPDATLEDDDLTNDSLSSELDEGDLEDSETFVRLSPRLSIAFPVSDRTQLHINYGIYYQRPDLINLFVGYDFYDARVDAGSFYPFPSPNLEPERITQYEFGLDHQLGDNTTFGITAYYKDVQDLTQIFHQAAIPTAYDYYANTDYGTIKGVDFDLSMHRTRNMTFDLKYSLSYATGTGSYAGSQRNIAWKNTQGTPKQTFPLDYDQRHSIIGMFDLRTTKGEGPRFGDIFPFENFGFNAIIQFASGVPYTPMKVYDGVSPNASVQQNPTGSINSASLPWQFIIDLKMERRFKVSDYEIVPYIWVKNVLDRENTVTVYEGTGVASTSGYLTSAEGQVRAADATTGEEFASRYELGQNNPTMYSNPRMIMMGLRMSF